MFCAPLPSIAALLTLLAASLSCSRDAVAPTSPPLQSSRQERAAAFRRLIQRPACPLSPDIRRTDGSSGWEELGSIQSEPGERVPFVLRRPAKTAGSLPVVILLHGTGGRKEQLSKLQNQLVELGFMAVAPDGRFHGARIPGGATDTSAYNRAIAAAWREKDPGRQTYPLYWQTVFDVGRLIDYLQTRDDVDRTRIGLVGFSKGGIEAWFAAAADPRVAAVVPAISVQSLKWSLENGRWQGRANTVKEAHLEAARDLGRTEITAEVCRKMWNKVLPGILNRFDCPQMLELIAPRPMLILNGENDPICPLPGAEIAFEAARRAYSDYPQRLEIDVARGVAHEVTEDQHRRMISWLVKHLQPDRR